jgi:hypothetical protein
MATKAEIIKAIDRLYSDDEQLIWQTVSIADVNGSIDDWEIFVDSADHYGAVADRITELVQDMFDEYEVD